MNKQTKLASLGYSLSSFYLSKAQTPGKEKHAVILTLQEKTEKQRNP